MDTVRDLRALLTRLLECSGSDFSGIGVVVCDRGTPLPTVSLRQDTPNIGGGTFETLAAIARPESRYHDGFHILDANRELIAVAQYFSPPIPATYQLPAHQLYGGRYVAALFGSSLPGVISTAIATRELGVVIFRRGEEVPFD